MWIYLCREMDPATRPPRLKPWLSTCHICDLQLSNQLFCHSTSPFLKKNKNITYCKNWYGDEIKYISDLNDLIVWVQILTFRFSSLYFVTSELEPQLLQWVLLLAELSSWRSLWTLSPGSRGLHCADWPLYTALPSLFCLTHCPGIGVCIWSGLNFVTFCRCSNFVISDH